jgi:hypothetical protein
VCTFDELVGATAAPAHRLETWLADLIGVLDEPLRALEGGAWRALQARRSGDLPPAHPWQERRKFLAVASGRSWLVKFAGLGRRGELRLTHSRLLAEAGFTPASIGLRHGFIEHRRGARRSLRECVGSMAPARRHARCERAPHRDRQPHARLGVARVRRCDPQDRCRRPSRRARSGCQDVAWDIAGAVVELGLSPAEERSLVERVSRLAGRGPPTSLIRFLHGCYFAFQLGYCDDAHAGACDPADAARLHSVRERYAAGLRAALASGALMPPAS